MRLLWYWRRPALRGIGLILLLSVAGAAISTLAEIPLAPWMRSLGLWPTLTGYWHGEVEAAGGRIALVYLEIEGRVFSADDKYRAGDQAISGSARWCDDRSRISDFRISGDPDNWRGTRFHLFFRNNAARRAGVSPSDLHGEWRGDDMRAAGMLDDGQPIRYRLRRGAEQEFLAACHR